MSPVRRKREQKSESTRRRWYVQCIESQNLENRINHEKDLLRDTRRKIRRRIPACRKPPQNIGPSWSMQVAVAFEDTPMGSLMEWTMKDMSMDKSTHGEDTHHGRTYLSPLLQRSSALTDSLSSCDSAFAMGADVYAVQNLHTWIFHVHPVERIFFFDGFAHFCVKIVIPDSGKSTSSRSVIADDREISDVRIEFLECRDSKTQEVAVSGAHDDERVVVVHIRRAALPVEHVH